MLQPVSCDECRCEQGEHRDRVTTVKPGSGGVLPALKKTFVDSEYA
jgi:hypothetical protein